MSCGGNIGIGIPGPQGPPGPTGPTGPGSGGTGGGNNVSIIGNVSGAPALISSGTLFLAGGNNVTLSQNGQSITISGGSSPGGIAASLAGNTLGALALISSGTFVLAGGNNVTLSQNGNSVTISANTAAAANLSVSAGSTTGAFGGLTFGNGSGVSFGLNNGTITGSVLGQTTQTQAAGNIAGIGTTFSGTNVSASMTLNSNGLNLAISAPAESGVGLSAAGSSQSAGAIVLSNANGVSFGMAGSTITASVAGGGGGATTGAIFAAGNTTGQSSSSTYPQSSLNLSLAGLISGGWSSNTFVISGPGTTGLTQLSAGFSTGGNTAGNTGLASAQLVLAGGANITLSGSTNGGSATISIIGGAGTGGGAGIGFGVSTAGNTAGATGTVTTGNVVLVGAGPISLSQATGGAGSAATITISAPATSSIVGTNGISISNNGSTISVSQISPIVFMTGNTTGQSSSSSYAPQSLILQGAGGVSVGWSGSTAIISGAVGGGGGGLGGIQVSNTTYTSGTVTLQNANGITFGSSGAGGISASYNSTQFAGTGTTFSGTNISASITHNSLGINLALSGAAGITTGGIYAVGNTTAQSSSSTFAQSSLNLSLAGVLSGGWSSNTFVISAPGTTGLTLLSAGFSTGGNTAGNTGLASNQLVLAGGANITLSGSTNAGSATISIIGGAGGGGVDITLGGNTSGALALVSTGTLFLAGGNNVTLSQNGNSVTISGANAGGAQTGISGFQVSNTTYTSGTVSLVNANGISFGSSGANGISASYTVPAQISTVGLYALGNTTQNSSTTLNQSALSFNALGAMTVGYSNSSIQLSAPAVSSISGTGIVSVSVNGSTISIGAAAIQQLSFFQAIPANNTTLTQIGQGTIQVYPALNPIPFSASRADIFASLLVSSLGLSSYAGAISEFIGIYTRSGSTLSLASSGSQSYQFTMTSSNSLAALSGLRRFSVPMNVNYTGGDIWMAVMSLTASTNGNSYSASNVAVPWGNSAPLQGLIGESSNSSRQYMPGMGIFTATSSVLPSSMAFSQISGVTTNSPIPNNLVPIVFANVTA